MGSHVDESQIHDSEEVHVVGTLLIYIPASMKWGTEWGKCVKPLRETKNLPAPKRSCETLVMNHAAESGLNPT